MCFYQPSCGQWCRRLALFDLERDVFRAQTVSRRQRKSAIAISAIYKLSRTVPWHIALPRSCIAWSTLIASWDFRFVISKFQLIVLKAHFDDTLAVFIWKLPAYVDSQLNFCLLLLTLQFCRLSICEIRTSCTLLYPGQPLLGENLVFVLILYAIGFDRDRSVSLWPNPNQLI